MKVLHNYSRYAYDDANHRLVNLRTGEFVKERVAYDGYCVVTLVNDDGRHQRLTKARAMMCTVRPLTSRDVVDHIDRNRLNDSWENLRIVDYRINALNRTKTTVMPWTDVEKAVMRRLLMSECNVMQLIRHFSYRSQASVRYMYTKLKKETRTN